MRGLEQDITAKRFILEIMLGIQFAACNNVSSFSLCTGTTEPKECHASEDIRPYEQTGVNSLAADVSRPAMSVI